MSRSGAKAGTTKSGVKSRRARNEKAARLMVFARRFGLVAGGAVFGLSLGSWLMLSGNAEAGVNWSRQKAYEIAGNAGFTVKDILVEGRLYSDPDVLRALINVERGDPIFAFDPKDTKDLIERIAWV